MKNSESMIHPLQKLAGKTSLSILLMSIASCGVTANPNPPTPGQVQGGPVYFAPYVAGTGDPQVLPIKFPQIYTIDDKNGTFSQGTYFLGSGVVTAQTVASGSVTMAQRGLRNLGITVSYSFNNQGSPTGQTNYPPTMPKPGSFAVELAGQTGGLVQMVGQPVAPLVAATQCPNPKMQTYLFVSIPAPLSQPILGQVTPALAWDPVMDTAYGSVDINASGTAVTFQNINQFTLPSVGGSGAPAQPAASSLTGACGSTSFGYLTGVPGQVILTDPNINGIIAPPQASIGINSAGLLVEDNGSWASEALPNTNPPLHYNNVLGAGTGAVGLLKPSSAVDTGAIVGAQYMGFIYSSGIYNGGQPPIGLASHLASFGFANTPSSCASVAPPSSTLIYGGDFTNDDPSTSPDGFGNCDFAVDLGAQDTSTNGLYPNATVWVGSGYATNPTSPTYSFKAVAIAGQINGKYAIFLVGAEPNSTQSWGVYLLQSN